jgi:hypothetical protein
MRFLDSFDTPKVSAVQRTLLSLDTVSGDSTGNWDPFAGIGGGGVNGGTSGGGLDWSNILNSAGSVFGSIWRTVNSPTQTILPGGGVLQNGQVYYPGGSIGGSGGSLLLLGILGLGAVLLLRK